MADNRYYNPYLDFAIGKPDNWSFLPTNWARQIMRRTALCNENMRELLEQAKAPFVYMQRHHSKPDAAIPTVQVSALAISRPDSKKRLMVMNQQLAMLRQFDKFRLFLHDSDCVAAGCPASHIEAKFSLLNDQGRSYSCRSELWTLYGQRFAFVVGLSASDDASEQIKLEQESVFASIRVDTAG